MARTTTNKPRTNVTVTFSDNTQYSFNIDEPTFQTLVDIDNIDLGTSEVKQLTQIFSILNADIDYKKIPLRETKNLAEALKAVISISYDDLKND